MNYIDRNCNSDARWYTHEEILAVLNHPTGTVLRRQEYKTMKDIEEGEDEKLTSESQQAAAALGNSDQSVDAKERVNLNGEPPFRVPPSTAIAGVLIRHWAEGRNGSILKKGNL